MRDGWRLVTLGEVLAEISRPVAVADLAEVRYAGVRWYAEGVYARDAVDASSVKAKEVTELREGDITYNRMWATKASFGLARSDVDGCHVTNDFPIFAAGPDLVAEYLELMFKVDAFQRRAADRATGTTERKRLKQRDFLSIPIALPLRQEQRRIVDLIAAVDDAIEAGEADSAQVALARASI